MPPFTEVQVIISNKHVCYKNVLPPRKDVFETHLKKYDACDTISYYIKMQEFDFDSIVDFIQNSGLMDIDLNYTEPVSHDGLVWHTTGGCGLSYNIITDETELILPHIVSYEIELPEILVEFNSLFQRIINRYPKK